MLPLWFSWRRIHLQCGRPRFDPCFGKIPQRRERLPTPVFWPGEFHELHSPWDRKESDKTEQLLGFPGGSAGKESAGNAGDLGVIPGSGRCPGLGRYPPPCLGGGNGYPLQYSGLENSMDYTVHGVSKSRAQLSDLHLYM